MRERSVDKVPVLYPWGPEWIWSPVPLWKSRCGGSKWQAWQAGRSRKLRTHILNCKYDTGRPNWNSQSSPQGHNFPATLHYLNLVKQYHALGTKWSNAWDNGDTHSNYHTKRNVDKIHKKGYSTFSSKRHRYKMQTMKSDSDIEYEWSLVKITHGIMSVWEAKII